ncbi:ROK family protein [Actinopolymorpha sp. B11F2]|uniref:ROK family protein n=1 Tax=Actinopolymorpha sp. B11F2 TaxID=3160862 RepID=UPI0032E41CB9
MTVPASLRVPVRTLVPVMDIGGTHVTAALFDPAAQAVLDSARQRRHRRPLDASASATDIVQRLVRCANDVAAPPDAAWGVALPGPFDYEGGIGLYEGVGKFDALKGVDLRQAFLDAVRPAPAEVHFLNDANAFAVGEWVSGAAAGHDRALALTLGTGVGSAFLDRGRIIEEGPAVPPEGRADLLTFNGQPLEETVSRRAVLARYSAMTRRDDPRLDVHDVAQRARDGDILAETVLSGTFRALGEALRPWVNRFGATVVVVGGSMAGSWDLIVRPLRTGLGGTYGPAVVHARHGDDATLIGAGIHTIRQGRRP